jgi:hypothetical protein
MGVIMDLASLQSLRHTASLSFSDVLCGKGLIRRPCSRAYKKCDDA